jgi:hypothetical protein
LMNHISRFLQGGAKAPPFLHQRGRGSRQLLRLAALVLATTPISLAGQAPDCNLVPGWKQDGPAREYAADNLFEYMDGNAEGYLIYGFVQMRGVTCKSADNVFVIDISEMTDPDSAYGLFTSNRDPSRPLEKIGMGGQIAPRRGAFAKGNSYVEIAASPDTDHTVALREFLEAMEKQVPGQSTSPEALAWFPFQNLQSVRLIPESVLGMRLLKRGYVAEYDTGKAFVVIEATPESAAAVMRKLQQRYADMQPVRVADEAFQTRDKYLGGLCVFRKGKYLGGYANLPDLESATKLATALAARVP